MSIILLSPPKGDEWRGCCCDLCGEVLAGTSVTSVTSVLTSEVFWPPKNLSSPVSLAVEMSTLRGVDLKVTTVSHRPFIMPNNLSSGDRWT